MLRAFQSRGWGVGKGDVSSSPLLPKFSFDVQFFADEPFNLIQDGGRGAQKGPPTSFSPVTSTNVGFGPQNFLTFSFKPFATLVQNFKFVPSAIPKLLNFNEDHPSKKAIFLVKSL